MSNHTKEPWDLSELIWYVVDGSGKPIASTYSTKLEKDEIEANAHRIVQCVNACADMKDPEKEIAQLRADRADLLEALKVLADGIYPSVFDSESYEVDDFIDLESIDNLIKRMEAGE
jgi:hypothetical protein